VPWTPLLIGGLVLNGIVPFLLYGWSKTIWVGVGRGVHAGARRRVPAGVGPRRL